MEIGSPMAAVQTSDPLIQARDVRVARGLKKIAPLNMSVFSGDVVALKGANGSGKTTLLRALAGLFKPLSGHLVTPVPFAFVGCEDVQNLELTVADQISFWQDFYDDRRQKKSSLFQVAEEWYLSLVLNQPIHSLSMGEKKRLSLARLSCGSFRLWLLDEPFANLDESMVEDVKTHIKDYASTGGGVVFTTPTAPPASLCCNEISVVGASCS